MKNKYLKLVFIVILATFIICVKSIVQANSISSIDMDIYVNNDGNAEVTETWNCNSTAQTEWYRSYYNLVNSRITNLRVSDNTKTYTTLSSWDVDASFNEKAYKCGLNEVNNGVEICWGKSQYGQNTYIIRYNISNFVSELTDSQMMYWTLIPQNHSANMGKIKIRVHADKPFADTIDVWGYGNYGGLCYVSNGAIHMQTEETLGESEYMTFLAKFPKETFNTSNVLDEDFNYYFEMAQDGSIAYQQEKESLLSKIIGFISSIMMFIPFIIVGVVSTIAASKKKYGFNYGEPGKVAKKDIMYYRDIPCDGDIFRAYYIAYQYELVKKDTDILGAIILKWLKQGIIRTEQKEQGKVFKKENTVIIMGEESKREFDNDKERKLFNMMYEASGDGILENKEFEKWCRKSYEKILDWFDDILKEQRGKLASKGLLQQKQGFWSKKYIATQELKQEAMQLAGLKKFLLEYTLIKERQAIEVELFEDYLIYAQMLGIAKQVSKQFKEIYPDMIEQTNYGSYDNLVYINYVSSRGVSSANSARAAAEGYSSGGGGFSSGGGGGGSFGGGGGIGSR